MCVCVCVCVTLYELLCVCVCVTACVSVFVSVCITMCVLNHIFTRVKMKWWSSLDCFSLEHMSAVATAIVDITKTGI